MKIVFVSNFLNHHQLPICLEFLRQTNQNFKFIATSPISLARLKFGYEDMNKKYPWVIRTYESQEQLDFAKRVILDADVVITGSAPEKLIKQRLKSKKLTFRYSERVYKKEPKWYEMPLRAIKYFFKHGRYKNLYMLCASAYTASDYARTGTFVDKCFKWGYFTEVKKYDSIEKLVSVKKKNSLIWVARFLSLKHPEYVVRLAKKLKDDGYDFEIKMIGNGLLFDNIADDIRENDLTNNIKLLGSMSPEKVRENMEQSEIFLFTSDRNEGWGAVLNEAMNSGCACVASKSIGAVPYLIENGKNGLIYKNDDFDEFYKKVKFLLVNSEKRADIGKKAYETMITEWNAEVAAEKFLKLVESYDGKKLNKIYVKGVVSEG